MSLQVFSKLLHVLRLCWQNCQRLRLCWQNSRIRAYGDSKSLMFIRFDGYFAISRHRKVLSWLIYLSFRWSVLKVNPTSQQKTLENIKSRKYRVVCFPDLQRNFLFIFLECRGFGCRNETGFRVMLLACVLILLLLSAHSLAFCLFVSNTLCTHSFILIYWKQFLAVFFEKIDCLDSSCMARKGF